MNAALMLVCLAGEVTAAQKDDIVFKAPLIQVTKDQDQGKEYLFALYNRVYMGRNYQKPKDKKDIGDPQKDFSRLPTTYFHDKSPIGMVLEKYNWFPGKNNIYDADARLPVSMIGMGLDPLAPLVNLWSEPPIAVLGMDVATIASYARPAQTMHFTERVPTFVKLSLPGQGEKRYFHFLQDALDRGAAVKVFEGEPRAMLEKHGGEGFYQAIVIETYKLPVSGIHKELLTKEALQMLMSKVRDDGIICYHTSNRYYDMAPIIASAAQELQYACVVGNDSAGWERDGYRDSFRFSSHWVMVARKEQHLAHLKAPEGSRGAYWSAPRRTGKKFVWSDKGENSFRGVYYSDPDIDKLHDTINDLFFVLVDKVGISDRTTHKSLELVRSLVRAWSARSARSKNGGPLASEGPRDEVNDEVIFAAPRIQVKSMLSYSRGADAPLPSYLTMIYNGINVGTNFRKPKNAADLGNPKTDLSRLATTYFHAQGPMGVALQKYNWFPGKANTYHADARGPASLIGFGPDPLSLVGVLWSEPPIAVVNMDVGTLASYARLAQTMHYFESSPTLVKLSLPDKGDDPLFHYIPDALARGANLKTFEGEPRAQLEKHGGAGFYQMIVVNTYKLPVITVHKDLMTKEGMKMLMSKTRDDGILCFHTSNRYYELAPIIASTAKDLHYAYLMGHDQNDDHEKGHFSSDWVMVARHKKHLAHLKAPPGYEEALARRDRFDPYWSVPKGDNKKYVWTDSGENSFRGLYRSNPAIDQFGDVVDRSLRGVADIFRFPGGYRLVQGVQGEIRAWSQRSAEEMNRDIPPEKK